MPPDVALQEEFVPVRSRVWVAGAGAVWDAVKARLAAVHVEQERAYLAEKGYRYVDDGGRPAAVA